MTLKARDMGATATSSGRMVRPKRRPHPNTGQFSCQDYFRSVVDRLTLAKLRISALVVLLQRTRALRIEDLSLTQAFGICLDAPSFGARSKLYKVAGVTRT